MTHILKKSWILPMEYYDLSEYEAGFITAKNGFGMPRRFGSGRYEIPSDVAPVFTWCKIFGHNQDQSNSKDLLGYINLDDNVGTTKPVITKYDAKRARRIIRDGKKFRFSRTNLITKIAISRNNMKIAVTAKSFDMAKLDYKADIFEFWDYYG